MFKYLGMTKYVFIRNIIYFIFFISTLNAKLISGLVYSELNGYDKNANQVIRMFNDLDMKIEAMDKISELLKIDPINPLYHYLDGEFKLRTFRFNDKNVNEIIKSFSRSKVLDQDYAVVISTLFIDQVENIRSPIYKIEKFEDLYILVSLNDIEDGILLLKMAEKMRVMSQYELSENEILSEFCEKIYFVLIKAISVSHKSKVLNDLAEHVLVTLNAYFSGVRQTSNSAYCNLIRIKNSRFLGFNDVKFIDGTSVGDGIRDDIFGVYKEHVEFFNGESLDEMLQISDLNFRLIGLPIKSMKMSPTNLDTHEKLFTNESGGRFVFQVESQKFWNKRFNFFCDLGNYDYAPYFLQNYLNVMDVKESKKRVIGRNKVIFDMYYLPRTPANIQKFTKMGNEEFLSWLKANIKPGLPDELKAE